MSSSSLRSALVPAALVLAESTWASVLLGVLVHGPTGAPADVPFLALVLPGLLAVVGGVAVSGWLGSFGARVCAVVVPTLLAMVLGALAYDSVVLGGAPADVLHPWALIGARGSAATIALWCCGLAALRGAAVGLIEPRVRSVIVSLSLGAAVMGITLVVAALHRGASFERAGRDAASLLVLAVPVGVAVLGLARERQLELAGSGRSMRQAGSGALLALAVPGGLVVLAALVMVVLGNVLAPPVGHGLLAAGRGIGTLLGDLFGLLRHVHLNVHLRARRRAIPPTAAAPPRLRLAPHAAGPVAWWLWALLALAGALILAALVALVIRALQRRPSRPARTPSIGEETRDSVFSFSHLLAQLRSVLSRHAREELAFARPPSPEAPSVRRHYRRLLVALRDAGMGRRSAETPDELAVRLGGEADLSALTELYEAARYGEDARARREVARAGELADAVVGALLAGSGESADEAGRTASEPAP